MTGCWPLPEPWATPAPTRWPATCAGSQRRRRRRRRSAQHRLPRPGRAADARRRLRGPRRRRASACCSCRDGDEHAGLPLDAVIYDICGRETWGAYDDLVARGVPLVVVEGPAWPGATYVDVEHRRGAAEVARHLHDLGHRRVATLTLDPSHPQREREAGLRDVFPDAEVIGPCASDLDAAQRARRRVAGTAAARRPPSSARATSRPRRWCSRPDGAGWTVPGDLSVAGFDGVADAVARPRAHDRRAAAGREGAGDRDGPCWRASPARSWTTCCCRSAAGGRLDGTGCRRRRDVSGGSSRCRAGRTRARTGSR